MRTTMDLPEDLLEEARKASGLKTMRETVIAGLQELIKKDKRRQLMDLVGKIDLDIDLQKSRKGKR